MLEFVAAAIIITVVLGFLDKFRGVFPLCKAELLQRDIHLCGKHCRMFGAEAGLGCLKRPCPG